MSKTPQFPIMKSGGMKIPWSVAEQAYLEYAKRYSDDQSLRRIAERGGFAASEMDILHPEWREHVRLKHERDAFAEALKAIAGDRQDMYEYCIENDIQKGIASWSTHALRIFGAQNILADQADKS